MAHEWSHVLVRMGILYKSELYSRGMNACAYMNNMYARIRINLYMNNMHVREDKE